MLKWMGRKIFTLLLLRNKIFFFVKHSLKVWNLLTILEKCLTKTFLLNYPEHISYHKRNSGCLKKFLTESLLLSSQNICFERKYRK